MSLTLAETVVDGLVLPGSRKSDPASRNHTPSGLRDESRRQSRRKVRKGEAVFQAGLSCLSLLMHISSTTNIDQQYLKVCPQVPKLVRQVFESGSRSSQAQSVDPSTRAGLRGVFLDTQQLSICEWPLGSQQTALIGCFGGSGGKREEHAACELRY